MHCIESLATLVAPALIQVSHSITGLLGQSFVVAYVLFGLFKLNITAKHVKSKHYSRSCCWELCVLIFGQLFMVACRLLSEDDNIILSAQKRGRAKSRITLHTDQSPAGLSDMLNNGKLGQTELCMEKTFSSNGNDDLFADFPDCEISRIHSLANQPEAKK